MEAETRAVNTEPEAQEQPALPIIRQVTIEPEGEQDGVVAAAAGAEAAVEEPLPLVVQAPLPAADEAVPEAAVAEAPSAEQEFDPYAEPEEEEQPILMALGVMDMDKKLGGGIPLETLTLVEGDPEAGKSVVIQQLAYGVLKEGLKVSIFLSEHTSREFLDQMDALGMNSTDYYLVGRLSLFEANLRVDQERAERLTRKLIKFIEATEGSDVYIVDSITPLLFQFDARYVLGFLATCKELAADGKTIMVTLHSYAINESLRLRADSIVDAHLRLKIEELGSQVVRTLEVAKIRGAVKTIGNAVSFSVEPGLGLKSIPISKTKA
jgi:flagellar protein FlaH